MNRELTHIELSILKSIDVWHQHIRPLFENAEDCPDCPKRFIYGCFCSFERLRIQESLDHLVKDGILSELSCTKDTAESCYRKSHV